MAYGLFVPDNYDPSQSYPLVFFLHGNGERGSDGKLHLTGNEGATVWAKPELQAKHPAFVLAPQSPIQNPDKDGNNRDGVWTNPGDNPYTPTKNLDTAYHILQKVMSEYKIDNDRIYSTGISMGGFGTWAINIQHPDLFAAMVPVAAYGDPVGAGQVLANKPIWQFTAEADPVIAVDLVRATIKGVRDAGGNPKYTEYPKSAFFFPVAHFSWVPAYADAEMKEWMFAQSKAGEVVYKNPNAPVEARVADLLGRMTLDEKIGQMLQGERANVTLKDVGDLYLGSILSGGGSAPASGNTMQDWYNTVVGYQQKALSTRLGIPIIYGVDAVHGHNNIYGATLFPHNIGLGAIAEGNEAAGIDIVKRIGAATAAELKATSIPWNFAPALADPQNISWGRTYEGFSEDLELVAKLGTAYVQGLQGESMSQLSSLDKAVATIKHFLGEGYTDNGTNQGNVTSMTREEVVAKLLKPYEEAINAGARSVMPSFNSIQGVKMHGSKFFLTDILKGQLGFDGLVISDYNGIEQINKDDDGNPVSGLKNQLKVSVNAGVDMLMQASNWKQCIALIKELVGDESTNPGTGITMARIDDAVSRILRVKFQAGLFENPFTPDPATNPEQAAKFGSDEHRALAREAVSQSLVLLKNDELNGSPILSQLKDMNNIFVAGKSADDIGLQAGGWTISWQGAAGNTTKGTTILKGIQNAASAGQTISYNKNGIGAAGKDVAIVVIGESPYAESNGDNLNALKLDQADRQTLANIKAAGIPTIVVLISGRPMDITEYLDDIDGLIAAWLPGTEGAGVADVLFGDQDFNGKLSMKWPFYQAALPLTASNTEYLLFNRGYGLTKAQTTPQLPNIPVHPHSLVPAGTVATELPAKIEAEKVVHQSGFAVSSDQGVTFLSSFAQGNYAKYYVNVPQDGTYRMEFRVNTIRPIKNAIAIVDKDGHNLGNVDFPNTNSSAWATVTKDIVLSAGEQFLTINVNDISDGALFYEPWIGGPAKLDWINLSIVDTVAAAAPTASPAAGTYNDEQSVILSSSTAGTTLYYTLDGSTPTATVSATVFEYNGPIIVSKTTTIKAIAVKDGLDNSEVAVFEYIIKAEPEAEAVAMPKADKVSGTYGSTQTVTLSCDTEGAAIYYTLDGSTPNTGSELYNGTPLTIAATTTLKVIAVKDGMQVSEINIYVYTIQ